MNSHPSSSDRINALVELSDKIYPIIETMKDNESTARYLLRSGMRIIADAFAHSKDTRSAGHSLHTLLITQLANHGLHIEDDVYAPFPTYRTNALTTPLIQLPQSFITSFDKISNLYSDVERATWSTITDSNETNAVHVLHLAAITLPYAAEYYPELDQAKIARYIWIHDILEAYTGDVPTFGISDEQNNLKAQSEKEAFIKLVEEFNSQYPAFISLVHDYETLADAESRFVKTFDKLDPGFTHFSSKGRQLMHVYKITDKQMFHDMAIPTTLRIEKYGSSFPLVLEDRMELHNRIGEVAWPEE